MAAKKPASVYMLRVVSGGEYYGHRQSVGEYVAWSSPSCTLHGDPTTWASAKATAWARGHMLTHGIDTKVVRFAEVMT